MKTIDEIRTRQTEIRSRILAIHNESEGKPLSDDLTTEWNTLNEEFDTGEKAIVARCSSSMDRIPVFG